jgi:hypothetical protein
MYGVRELSPKDGTTRRLMARVTDAINAPLREMGRRGDADTRGDQEVGIHVAPDRVGAPARPSRGGVSRSTMVEQPLLGGTGPAPRQPRRGRAPTSAAAKVTKVRTGRAVADHLTSRVPVSNSGQMQSRCPAPRSFETVHRTSHSRLQPPRSLAAAAKPARSAGPAVDCLIPITS